MTIRKHQMPFGAQVIDQTRTSFRLWAPAAREISVVLEASAERGRREVPMAQHNDGWWEAVTLAQAGVRYRYLIDDEHEVPDPASRFNPDDVHGPSEVVDPGAYAWQDHDWRGRPWEEAVIYELHVGTFSPAGTFAGVAERLDYLCDLGVSAIELMPVADFPGKRGWGYDGVLPYAPDASYGRPEDLKRLIEAAHARGLMVLLDVVYNHFGPEGNYLHRYAPEFFTQRHHTPWGAAINFDGPDARVVRDFYIHNALYWIEEFRVDGLRLDAVHAIVDDSQPDILKELAAAVRQGPGREREVHLVLENDRNQARYLAREAGGDARHYTAQWNDDFHHALHVLLTGERDGYYVDYGHRATELLGRCLTQGFAYQGDLSQYRHHAARGEPSAHLPPSAFVSFLQTHDQVGNRALGERLGMLTNPQALRAALVVWLLAPAPPLLFMGEEFGALTPFQYFCDYQGDLAAAVREGRRREFAGFAKFADAQSLEEIPDPNDPQTFLRSKLAWDCIRRAPHADWLALYTRLLALRREWIVPRLAGMVGAAGRAEVLAQGALACEWELGDGSRLHVLLNLASHEVALPNRIDGRLLVCQPPDALAKLAARRLPPQCAACYLSVRENANGSPGS